MPAAQPKTEKDFARRYGAQDERTVRRWKKDGAPLGDDEAMRAWLRAKVRIPYATSVFLQGGNQSQVDAAVANSIGKPRCVHLPKERIRPVSPVVVQTGLQTGLPKPQAPDSDADTEVRGAAASLKRLEAAENEAYKMWQSALFSGELISQEVIDDHRNAWLKLSEQLRKVDLAIEADRRASGSLVPREVLETYAAGLVVNLFGSLKASLESLEPKLAGLPTPQAVSQIWRPAYDKAVLQAVENSSRPYKGQGPPGWLLKRIREAIAAHL